MYVNCDCNPPLSLPALRPVPPPLASILPPVTVRHRTVSALCEDFTVTLTVRVNSNSTRSSASEADSAVGSEIIQRFKEVGRRPFDCNKTLPPLWTPFNGPYTVYRILRYTVRSVTKSFTVYGRNRIWHGGIPTGSIFPNKTPSTLRHASLPPRLAFDLPSGGSLISPDSRTFN
jgi:hypothetical protein